MLVTDDGKVVFPTKLSPQRRLIILPPTFDTPVMLLRELAVDVFPQPEVDAFK